MALGTPPDAGLDGTLSVALVPNSSGWSEVSLMAKLEEKYMWPTVFVSFNFYEKQGLYAGIISFKEEEIQTLQLDRSKILYSNLTSHTFICMLIKHTSIMLAAPI